MSKPRRLAPRPGVIAMPILLVYAVALGGAPPGELVGWLRALSAIMGAAIVGLYVTRLPSRHDRLDQASVAALLLFAVSSLVSAFPRQSLDAVLGVLLWVAAFYLLRTVLQTWGARAMVVRTFTGLSAIITVGLFTRIASSNAQFLELTSWSVVPPLGLKFESTPWGHPYDAVLLAIMLYPSWFLARPSRARLVAATLIGLMLLVVVVLAGSRVVWAAGLGGLAIGALPAVAARGRSLGRRGVVAGAVASLVIATAAITAAPTLLDRLLNLTTLGQRGEMWLAGIEAWLARPIAGYGPGSFAWVLQQTSYFDTNTLAPRHPDSAIFQLLPEAGLLGVAAAAIILVALIPRLVRPGSSMARWALATFAFASLGQNPTDFPYLVIVAITWAALASPRALMPHAPVRASRLVRLGTYASLAVIGVAVASMAAGGIMYDSARALVQAGHEAEAADSLDAAVRLDPGMAIYPRQRGTLRLLRGDLAGAIDDLLAATTRNRSDDLAWRTLALAYEDDDQPTRAEAALRAAITLQRSDPSNLLLAATWKAAGEDQDQILAEVIQAWPTIVAAERWGDLATVPDTRDIIGRALMRWQDGIPSLEPPNTQGLWLAALASRPELVEDMVAGSADPVLARATIHAAICGPGPASATEALPTSSQRSSDYWALAVQQSAEIGEFDQRAAQGYALTAERELGPDAWRTVLNPLHENDTRGYSADRWGYRRLPIRWPDIEPGLPSPDSGALRWILDPAGARDQTDAAALPSCSP